jgi:hypothetical protein
MRYLALTVCSLALHAQTPAAGANPFLGSWRMNFEKSGITAGAGVIVIRQYQDQGGGLMLHTIVTITPDPDHGARFDFVAAKYDGKTMTETVKAFDPKGKQTDSAVVVYDKQ